MDSDRFNPTKKQREKAFASAMKRKEEYLGARVPKELRDRVIARAKELGIPVSILIRNILEDAFRDSTDTDTQLQPQLQVADQDVLDSVLAWDKITLNKSVSCAKCGAVLAAGDEALMGLGTATPIVVCNCCG